MKLLGIVIGLIALCMFVGNSFAKDAAAKGDKAGKGDVVMGKVSAAVDKDGNIKIKKHVKKDAAATAPAAPEEVTIATDASTVVTIDKVAGKVSDIQVDMYVKISPATGTAKTIDASTKKPEGRNKKPKQ